MFLGPLGPRNVSKHQRLNARCCQVNVRKRTKTGTIQKATLAQAPGQFGNIRCNLVSIVFVWGAVNCQPDHLIFWRRRTSRRSRRDHQRDEACTTTRAEKAKMLASELHRSADPEVVTDRERGERPLAQYNAFSGEATNDCTALLREPLGGIGVGTVIKPIFACDYVCNVRFGRNAFVNCHGVFLGCAPIAIGDDVQKDRRFTSTPPSIRSRRRTDPAWSAPARSASAVMRGLGVAPSFSRA